MAKPNKQTAQELNISKGDEAERVQTEENKLDDATAAEMLAETAAQTENPEIADRIQEMADDLTAGSSQEDDDVTNNASGAPTNEQREPEQQKLDEQQGDGFDEGPLYTKPGAELDENAKLIVSVANGEQLVDEDFIAAVVKMALAGGLQPKDIREAVNEQLKGKTSRTGNGSTVTLLNRDYKGAKMATQAIGVLDCLNDHGGEMSKDQLIQELSGYIKTVQTPQRIVQFYQKSLIEGGYIEVN